MAEQGFRVGRLIQGLGLAIIGHALEFGAGFLAARLVEPSQGGGFEDVAAAVGAFLLVGAVVGLVCLISGFVLIVRGKRDLGTGLLVGWLVGAGFIAAILFGGA